jgi:hypothetical protein
MKYSHNDLNFNSIPKNIYFYLISFINESVNGVDAIANIRTDNFCYLLLKYKLPNGFAYWEKFYRSSSFQYPFDLNWRKHLDFVSKSPSKEEVKVFFGIPVDINDWIMPPPIHCAFFSAIVELFCQEFSDENVISLYESPNYNFGFLTSFTKRYFSIISQEKLISIYNGSKRRSHLEKSFACSELEKRFGVTMEFCYLLTRSVLNDLSLDLLRSFDGDSILQQLKMFSSSSMMYNTEVLVTVMNSNLISPYHRYKFLVYNLTGDQGFENYEFIKEVVEPINFMGQDDTNDKPLTVHIANCCKEIQLPFFECIDDPLILIIMLKYTNFPELGSIIQEKNLDLNNIYKFKLDFYGFIGRTMHFKQILKELNDLELNEVFNLDANDLNNDHSTIDESLPIVIFDKNYTLTLNSH